MKTLIKISNEHIPIGTQALILSKLYYGVIVKSLEKLDIERYFSVLYFLMNNNGCCQQTICNNMAIDKTAMVKVMNYLIKKGYVERRKNPNDKREQFIFLTKKGETKTEKIKESFQSLDATMFAGVSEKKRSEFLNTMSKLSSNLKDMPSNDLFFNYKLTQKK
jgi:DNA-binding MarR family transcriptional regulator